MDVLLLDRPSKLVRKLLVEPDPILPIDIQAIMGMTIRGGSMVEGERTASTCWKRAKNALVRVVKPNSVVAINANSRGMCTTGTTHQRIEILLHPFIRPGHGCATFNSAMAAANPSDHQMLPL